jgi:hypothetical protein
MRIHALLIIFILTTSSCILPIPHKRLHGPGASGAVLDAQSKTPIPGATVTPIDDNRTTVITDAKGHFSIPPLYGWHGAAVVFPPGPSLFPSLDVPSDTREVITRATGYLEQRSTFKARNPGAEFAESKAIELRRNP